MENANGRTPLEIAQTQYLTQIIETTVEVPIDQAYFNSVTRRDISHWELPEEIEERRIADEKSSKYSVERRGEDVIETYRAALELATEAAEQEEKKIQAQTTDATGDVVPERKGEGTKRKLVGLADANELARRISSGAHKLNASYADYGDVLAAFSWNSVNVDGCNPYGPNFEADEEDMDTIVESV